MTISLRNFGGRIEHNVGSKKFVSAVINLYISKTRNIGALAYVKAVSRNRKKRDNDKYDNLDPKYRAITPGIGGRFFLKEDI